jgi:hypothetical protein
LLAMTEKKLARSFRYKRAHARRETAGVARDLYRRHCERSEAIQLSCGCAMDCFALLAMTDRTEPLDDTP